MKAPAKPVRPRRVERRRLERAGTATFEVRVINYAQPGRASRRRAV